MLSTTSSRQIKVVSDKGYLRLQFPSTLSTLLYGKRQFYKSLGRKDTPQNREWAERIAARIQADLDHPDSENLFDLTLAKYLAVAVKVSLPQSGQTLKLKDVWLEFVEQKRKTQQISETTYQTRYRRTYANWLKPYLDDLLTYELAETVLSDLLKAGVNRSNLKKLISALEEACARALNRGFISRNFFANLDERIKLPKRSQQLIEEEDYRAYNLQERDMIITAFREADKASERRIADLVEFLFLTGCRLGEAFALRWNDIRPNWIVFDESYSSETKITKSTKTDTIRIFRTKNYQRLNQLIDSLKTKDCKQSDYVFTTLSSKQYNRFRLNAAWKGISNSRKARPHYYSGVISRLVKAGKLKQYLKPSATRHTFITIQAHNGTDLKLLADSVGNSVDTIYNHYLGVNKDAIIANI